MGHLIWVFSNGVVAFSQCARFEVESAIVAGWQVRYKIMRNNHAEWMHIMATQVVTAHIPKDIVERIDALASRLDRPRGWAIKEALCDWIASEEERHQLIEQGLADVAAGRLVDHDLVKRWAASLGTDKPMPLPVG
jgi:predicted transcriptional regulator